MTGRNSSGYGSFRLGKGLINLKRTEHRPLFSQVLKMMPPVGEYRRVFFVPGSVDMPGAENSSRAILYIERNPETVKSITSFPYR
jgi:hypothetical protein